MICPQCRGEYREGFTACATCGIPLIPHRERNPYWSQGGTAAVLTAFLLVAGLLTLIGLGSAEARWWWYAVPFGIGGIIYLLRSRFHF